MNYDELNKEDLIRINAEKDRRIEQLEFELKDIKRLIFGSKSERFESAVQADQINIFGQTTLGPQNEVEEVEVVVKKKKKKRVNQGRQKLSEHLERKEQILTPDMDVSGMQVVGQVVTEKLEMTPAQFYVKKIIRLKYVDQNGHFYIAELPSDPFGRFIVGTSVATQVTLGKYLDHQPLYRQRKMYLRHQVNLPESTLNDLVKRTHFLLKPLYEYLCKIILTSTYLQVDESSLSVMTRDHPGSTKKGTILVKVAPTDQLCVFQYIKTKHKANLLDNLRGFKGHLQVDGNVSYEEMQEHSGVTLMHCLAHSRRYFEKAMDYDKDRASHVLSEIQKIYLIDRSIRERNLSVDQIAEERRARMIEIFGDLKTWMEKEILQVIPGTPIDKAIKYALKRWDGLIEFIQGGHLRPDNNLIENQIRRLALGRKNFLFGGSHQGAEYASLFYSMIATCQLNQICPYEWLNDVLPRILHHPINRISELLPTKDYKFSRI